MEYEYTSLSFSILFLIVSVLSSIWLGFVIKKKMIGSRTIVAWLSINIIFLFFSLYIMIISIIDVLDRSIDYKKYNFFDLIAKKLFNISHNGWILIIVLLLVLISIIISINVIVKYNVQNKRINDLNRNLAILKGKIAIDVKEVDFDTSEISAEELKFLLDEKLQKEKLKQKYKNKLERLAQRDETEIDIDVMLNTKTLLNVDEKKIETKTKNKRKDK